MDQVKTFCAKHLLLGTETVFQESSAPDWLTCKGTVKGSTMDNSWFFKELVLSIEISQSVDTDFHRITRLS